MRRVPTETDLGRSTTAAGLSDFTVSDGTGSESSRKSLIGRFLFTAILICSSFTVLRFFSIATSADFSASNCKKSSVDRDTKNKASELTLFTSLSRVIIFFTLLFGNSGSNDSVFSSSSPITVAITIPNSFLLSYNIILISNPN
ncbi:hypothetical protein MtrunA17_Chr3g0122581 [Medicago truncatula]|uniref:Transmembrane protein n=1 Tax=Medicago truncatula TaxID=3880 RepID=A0A396IXU5_MEDTR|nr:hypothetical protein MtrunA17_Chr3g0122581 [Medicago truncatula]